jgi:uncharacterized protein YjiS (DUF1127 family)
MSATSNTFKTPHGLFEPARPGAVPAALRRWWVAFRNMLLERAAVAALSSMSDRDLRDIGVYRCEIEQCVRLVTSNGRRDRHSADRQRRLGSAR